jgi:hypothetical protein
LSLTVGAGVGKNSVKSFQKVKEKRLLVHGIFFYRIGLNRRLTLSEKKVFYETHFSPCQCSPATLSFKIKMPGEFPRLVFGTPNFKQATSPILIFCIDDGLRYKGQIKAEE